MLLPVLRVTGPSILIDALLEAVQMRPYKLDSPRSDTTLTTAHFDFGACEIDQISNLEMRLQENMADLREMAEAPSAVRRELDIGMTFNEGFVTASLIMHAPLLRLAADLNFSISITAYPTSAADKA